MFKIASALLPLLIIAAVQAQTPVAPVQTFPSDKAVNVLTATSLKWHKTAGATGYAVQLSTDTTFATPLLDDSALTDTLDHVSHLTDTTVYFWHVRALGASGFGPYSKVHSFTTAPPLDAGPTIIVPPDVTPPPLMPTLMWNTFAGAKTYAVQISTANNFSTLNLTEASISDTTYTPKGLDLGTGYYWHVRANTSPVPSAWSKGFFNTGGTAAVAAKAKAGDAGFRALAASRGVAVEFQLAKAGHVRIVAFRIGGQSRVLAQSDLGAGLHRVSGPALAPGVWWVRMETKESVRTQSIFLP
jgi:hypothetical protein